LEQPKQGKRIKFIVVDTCVECNEDLEDCRCKDANIAEPEKLFDDMVSEEGPSHRPNVVSFRNANLSEHVETEQSIGVDFGKPKRF
jgi:hypothetical protein